MNASRDCPTCQWKGRRTGGPRRPVAVGASPTWDQLAGGGHAGRRCPLVSPVLNRLVGPWHRLLFAPTFDLNSFYSAWYSYELGLIACKIMQHHLQGLVS